ncbi:uncharacterized protein LOC144876852 [Branchiostoma floridae x Branchiostoma japonicum]
MIPDPITSTSNQIFVRYTSDITSDFTYQRFEFSYSATDFTTTTEAATTSAPCGGALRAPPGGTVTVESPNYPVYYDGRASCEWTINVNWPRVVLLTFHGRFHLWRNDEHLTIYDGGSDDAPLLQRLTGFHWYINPITSTSGQMFVKLTSSVRFELSGFQFSYSDTAPTTTTLATTHISTTPTVATTTTTTTDVPTTTTETTTTTLATTIVPTTTTYATTLATTTPTPCTVLPGENDIYLLDDGITEVVAGEDARLNWTYSLRVDSAILLEDWKDPDGNYIMRRIGGVVFENHEYKGRVSLIGDSSLLLNGTGPADAGSYTLTTYFCDVSEHEAERQLIVQYAPKLPRIEVTPGLISTEGDTMILQATADCVPPATYTWNRLDGSLPTNAVVNATLGTLTITEATVEDSGVYTVVAENYLGNSSAKNITVEVGPIPIIGEVAFVASTAVIDGGGPAVSTGQHITPRPVNPSGLLTTLEIVLIALGLTLLVTVLLVGGLRFWWVKKKRARAGRDGGRWYFHPFILDRVYPLAEQPPPPVPARPQFLKYEVDRQDLELGEQIGRGAFGVVYKAVLKRTAAGLVTNRTVVVKTVQDGAGVEERVTFVREIETTINLGEHKNLLGLVGCCTLANPPYLVTEYLPYGDLKNFLLKCRLPQENELNSVYHMTDLKMYQIGRQIANGMVFISDAGYVHGDLAARNVLVGKDLLVKIADFGLATDVYERGYQRQDAEQKIPVRWMAPERLLREGRYTSKSDVWSFGVVLYEIASLGDVPYPSLGRTLLEELRRGRREQRPQRCPWELYNMMLSCWQWEEFNRPDFQQLYLELDWLVETNADVSYLKLSSAPSGNEKSSGDIFSASLASCHHSLETQGTSATSEASEHLQKSRAETQPFEEGLGSKEPEDVAIVAEDSETTRDQILTNKCVPYNFPLKNKWVEESQGNSTSSSVEVEFVDPQTSAGRYSTDRVNIGTDTCVYYKAPSRRNLTNEDPKEAQTSQLPDEDGRESNEAEDVATGRADDSETDHDQTSTTKGAPYNFLHKNKWLEESHDNPDLYSAEVQFVESRRSTKTLSTDRAKIGVDSCVYHKVPTKNNHRRLQQDSFDVIDQMEVVDLDL